ncbi:MAG: hypothetical protein R3C15_13155 [Thermoleophilia bacterium]
MSRSTGLRPFPPARERPRATVQRCVLAAALACSLVLAGEDVLTGGPGTDTTRVDPVDTVTGCETVLR